MSVEGRAVSLMPEGPEPCGAAYTEQETAAGFLGAAGPPGIHRGAVEDPSCWNELISVICQLPGPPLLPTSVMGKSAHQV